MTVPGSVNPLLLRSAVTPGAYTIFRSLRFNSANSAYLSRTPGSAGNRTTYTFACWVKRATLGTRQKIISATNGIDSDALYFHEDNTLRFFQQDGVVSNLITTQVFRDVSAWYHLLVSVDTTQGTSSNRIKLYVNGSQVTTFSTATYPSSSYTGGINNTVAHNIGRRSSGADYYLSAFVADAFLIDGQALTPSSFGETDANGIWQPKAYSGGNYGTNGFRLDFSDYSSASATAIGADRSGNGNNFTPTNISVNTGGPTSVAATSNALPIYNTTGTYGTTKGTGTRTDSNSSSIVLAVPMDGTNGGTTFTDESATIKGSGSAKSLTRVGATTSTSTSKYYGSSGDFNGTSTTKYLSFSPGTDLAFGTGDFTIEAWVNMSSMTTGGINQTVFVVSGGTSMQLYHSSTRGLRKLVFNDGTSNFVTTNAVINAGAWQHFAVTRQGTTLRIFVDGITQLSSTCSTNFIAQTTAYIGGTGTATENTNGYIQDFRIYKSVAKYTTNFNVPLSSQNIPVGYGCDTFTDSPTNSTASTGGDPGGVIAGNYCTWDPLNRDLPTGPMSTNVGTVTNGNLQLTGHPVTANTNTVGNIGVSSGKWYFEITKPSTSSGFTPSNGVGFYLQGTSIEAIYTDLASFQYNGTSINYGSGSWKAGGSVVGVALDLDNTSIAFYRNGIYEGVAKSDLPAGTWIPFMLYETGVTFFGNFGQRPFVYPAPAGYRSINTANLPAPTIQKPASVFDVKLRNGFGTAGGTVSGLGFSPDFVWHKPRSSSATNHWLIDSVRGASKVLLSNTTGAEFTDTNFLTSFTSDGYTIGTTDWGTSEALASWTWDAGSSAAASNNSGSIVSTVKANASAGFSIVTYTGNGTAGATVGHGLGVAPEFIICKSRSGTTGWLVYHKSLGNTNYLVLNTNAASAAATGAWNNTSPTSTVFTLGNGTFANTNGATQVAYCFTPVANYSAYGSYGGNGLTDGPFIWLGFCPAVLIIKSYVLSRDWVILDNQRIGYNIDNNPLFPNLPNVEGTTDLVDFTSNGFKIRTTDVLVNSASSSFVYAAWAESPFQYARAR